MDRVFPVDDLADEFWLPHAPPSFRLHDDAEVNQPFSSAAAPSSSKMMGMNRSASEYAFQRFLQEADHNTTILPSDDVAAINDNDRHYSVNQHQETVSAAAEPPLNIPLDSDEYQAVLKSRLELACAAVALSRATNGKASESAAAVAGFGSLGSSSSLNEANGRNSLKTKVMESSGPPGVLPLLAREYVAQVRSTTSGSSGEQSDDDEAEGVTEATQNMGPADSKHMRRMLSNRESARRSRRRKQVHLTELEMQVSKSGVENSSLLKRLTEISQKYNEAAVDNRVLKADVETLRAKVKMAEESVKSVTGLKTLFQSMSDICTTSMPSFAGNPSNTATDGGVPARDNPKQH